MGEETPLDRPDFDPSKVGTPDECITTHVDIRAYLAHKIEALRCHRSQVTLDWWYFRLPANVLYEKFGREFFVRIVSHVPVNGDEHDLFAGLR
jgi:N-acetyl-1-D-myo-inositol-2-amino-2-deoxy-alpha-D-glucopyranoside deacetylase